MLKKFYSSPQYIVRAFIITLFLGMFGGAWDVWWHTVTNLDADPLSAPDIMLTGCVSLTILGSIIAWFRFRDRIWRNLSIIGSIVLLMAPVDQILHNFIEESDPSTPLIIVSPAHTIMVAGLIGIWIVLLDLLKNDTKEAQSAFGSLVFSTLLLLVLFAAQPLSPVSAWHAIGYYGAFFETLIIAGFLIVAFLKLPGMLRATFVTFVFLVPFSFSLNIGEPPSYINGVLTISERPLWLVAGSFLATAGAVDFTGKLPIYVRGLLAGFVWSCIFYVLPQLLYNFDIQNSYSFNDTIVAMVTGTLGGITAGIFIQFFTKLGKISKLD